MRQSSWFLASCLLVACFYALSNAQIQTFQGQIYYHEPSMGIGVLNGTIVYDYVYTDSSQVPSYFMNFGAQIYSVLYQYNYVHGIAFTTAQWRYRSGPGCPGGCETGALNEQMPQLFVSSAAYTATTTTSTINGVLCTLYTPKNASSTVSQLYVAKSNTSQLCQAVFSNGNSITFLTMYAVSHPVTSGVFTPPTACSCGKPIDLSIVLDRSGSVQYWQFLKMKSFLQSLANTFKISTTQTQWAITHFNTDAWNELTIAAGNTQTAVTNVINGLKCCETIQNDNSSCCLGGTSISAGFQLGAYQLTPTLTGVRSYATKVVILLTDGFHNTLSDGKDTWCYQPNSNGCGRNSNGDPCGDTNPKDGISDDWEPCVATGGWQPSSCKNGPMAQCHRDLINGREYGYYIAGDNLITFAIGVGSDVAIPELKIITDNLFKYSPTPSCTGTTTVPKCISSTYVPCSGSVTPSCMAQDLTNPERVITTDDWNSLGSTLLRLSSLVCDSNAEPCGSCCGYCACGICSRPDSCPTTNFCDVGVFVGNCCSTTPRVCTPTNACYTATCDRTANGGAGGCVQTAKTCPAEDNCYRHVCDPNQQGACVDVFKGVPASDLCHVSGCVNGQLVNNTAKNCAGADACRTYSCDLSTGNCVDVAKTIPTAPNCKQYKCNSSATGNPFYLVDVVCPTVADKCNPLVCNVKSGQCETNTTVCNDPTNLCDLTTCNSATGNCNAKTYKTCTAGACQENCTCSPTSGACSCQSVVCAPDSCITYSCSMSNSSCVPDFAVCPLGCEDSNCGERNNQCYDFKCNSTITNDADKGNCYIVTNIGAINCKQDLVDKCLTNARCDNKTGCHYDKVECGTPPTCKEYISNSSLVGCCQEIDKNCDKGDPCYEYGCNMTTGACYSNPRCIIDDLCTLSGCYPNGTCWQTPVICTSSNPCRIAQPCDPATGACLTTPKNCSDEVPCTADSCNATTGDCIHIPCSDGNPCTIDTCDSNGACLFPPRNCSDGNMCTIDTCNSTAADNEATDPCVHETILDSTCDDNNQCTDDMCVPASGCVNVVFNVTERCPVSDGCTKAACFPTLGCQNISRTCYLDPNTGLAIEVVAVDDDTPRNYTDNSDCSYATCQVDPQTGQGACTKISLVCGSAITTGVITAVALGAGVIVGIIVAALVCVGASGGGAFAAYQKFGGEGDATLQSNPLYEATGRGGANPLWETPADA